MVTTVNPLPYEVARYFHEMLLGENTFMSKYEYEKMHGINGKKQR